MYSGGQPLGGEPAAHDGECGSAPGPVDNEISGVVHGSAVQARDIHGGLHFSVTQPGQHKMPVPAQLPPAPANFTGRVRELAGLKSAVEEYDPVRRLTLVVITGPGGAGKTSMAAHWLHDISGHYKGGALYADLRGHTPADAAAPGELLTGFLSALGTPPERIPLGLGEQAKLFRSLTSGRRMLMLLDNAASAAQIRALLPGPGPPAAPKISETSSLVVVTTRWRIAGLAMDGARFVETGPLDDRSGAELLGRIIGDDKAAAEPEAIGAVVQRCGGLPLALCAAGARLASHPWWPVGRVAAELADENDRLAALTVDADLSVRAAFDVSYHALPEATARLYRLLSLIPAPDFGTEVAAATAAVAPHKADQLLDELTTASLLEPIAAQRYRFHDLIKLHARDRAQAESSQERTATIARAVGWYLTKAVAADVVIIPGRWRLNPMYDSARTGPPAYPGALQALGWAESELPSLIAAVEAAHDEGLHEQAWQLCEALWGLFTYRKYFRYWIQAHLLGIASARACGSRRAEAEMRVHLGTAYLNLGRLKQARQEFVRALELDQSERHWLGEGTALEHLGLTDLALGRSDDAIAWFRQARDIFSQADRPRGIMRNTRHIGEGHRDAGRHEQAVQHLLQARRMATALPDPYDEARCLTSLGQAYLKVGKPAAAAIALDEALELMVPIGGRYEQARILSILADAVLRLNRPDRAREHLTGALEIYSAIDAPEAADIQRRLGDLDAPGDAPAG